MENFQNETVGSIVARNWKTSFVFQKHNIDFCCNGAISLSEACVKNGVDIGILSQEILRSMQTTADPQKDFDVWELDLLAEYIEAKHHKYTAEKMPQILANLNKICLVHGTNHSELLEIRDLFRDIAHELTVHMKKEEFMIFPVIKKMVWAGNQQQNIPSQTYGSIQNPIAVMMQDHENEGERMRKIAALSDNYRPAPDACTTYKASFFMLKEFESDLHKHKHLENNILFPKAVQLEKEMQAAY
ncbi:iron-sulfur cluster repair di-iron protein [Dyadobacter sp. CY347]|uniref:iron-sulfur cluster repair di-iron protein n=1 Tax=Dyadobacter sp. CY347 TaxID=2909336 RepID=UPI001F1E829D|nr:iron-sulfur cluster repair di-iron protein [Dyadobacter sp. CY347]MCF2487769.1 iron-sulfur cluster repair di-iron protein [Dyadobacter sp. CY347]